MEKFIIVQVDYHYCNYLREFDNRVPYNYGHKKLRPFLGILFKVEDIEYFAPLSSPKEKHKKMVNSIDFVKIDNGYLGAINFNNMIPVSTKTYKIIDLKEDISYNRLLQKQIRWLNRNYDSIKNIA